MTLELVSLSETTVRPINWLLTSVMKTRKSTILISRIVSVLKSFDPQHLDLSVTEIARKVGIPKASAYRILMELAEGGLLERNPKTAKFKIGPTLYTLGNLYLNTTDILIAAEPVVKTLNSLTSEAVSISILDKGYVTLIMREEARHPFRITFHIGSTIVAYASAMGKALLSQLTEAEIDNIYPTERLQPVTKKTITTKARLKQELQQIRKTGLSYTSEEAFEGVESMASVIRDVRHRAIAAMSIQVPIFRMSEAHHERLGTLVKMGASLISFRLGCPESTIQDIREICAWWEQNQATTASEIATKLDKVEFA